MRKLERYFRFARSRKTTVINPVVSHSDTPATGQIRSKVPPTFATDVRSWHRSFLIPPAHKKRDSGFLIEQRSRERSRGSSPLLPGISTPVHEYCITRFGKSWGKNATESRDMPVGFPPASIRRRRDSVPYRAPRCTQPITNENERRLGLIERGSPLNLSRQYIANADLLRAKYGDIDTSLYPARVRICARGWL